MSPQQIVHTDHIKTGLLNASYLTIGNVASQIVAFAGFIYITRILGPTNYGIYSMVGAFAAMFTIFTFSGLNKVVLRECSKNISNMEQIMEQTIGVRNLFSSLAWFLCAATCLFVSYEAQAKLYVILISFEMLIFSGVRESLNTVYQAVEKMQFISILTTSRTIISVLLAILFLSMGFGVLALILIQVIVALITLILNYHLSRQFVRFNFLAKVTFEKEMVKQGFTFSLIQFFSTLSTKVDLVMLSFLGTPMDVGIYALPFKMVKRTNMVRNMVSTSFFPILVKRFEQGKISGSSLLKRTLSVALPALALAIIVAFSADDLILFFFGETYSQSATILKVLIFYVVINFIYLPFGLSLQSTHNERISLTLTMIEGLLNIFLNFLFFYFYGVIGIAYSTLVTASFKCILVCSIGYRKLRQEGYII